MRRAERYAKAAHCLDLVLEYFGPNGERWYQGNMGDGPKRCIVAAVYHVQYQHRFRNKLTFALIDAGIPGRSIGDFNDDPATSFAQVRAVIIKAKARALTEARKRPSTPQGETQHLKLAA
jgi:hypothetical protein